MSQRSEIEFVCYAEGGLFNLERAFENLLPQTLVKLPPDDESNWTSPSNPNGTRELTFRPRVRTLELYRAVDDLVPQSDHQISQFDRRESYQRDREFLTFLATTSERVRPITNPNEVGEADSLGLARPVLERVFPFKRAIESDSRQTLLPPESAEGADPLPRSLIQEPARQERLGATLERVGPRTFEPALAVRDQVSQTLARVKPSLPSLDSQRAFHDLLATRSQISDEKRRRTPFVRPTGWLNVMIWIIGELIIFAGGGAVGAGVMALSRGESIQGMAGVVIASGIIAVTAVILIRKIPTRPKTEMIKALPRPAAASA